MLQFIFLRKMNVLQVYNKLEVFRTFYKFSQELLSFCLTTRLVLRSSQSTQWKVQLTRSVSRVFCIFKWFPASYKIVQCFLQVTLRFGLFPESWEEEHFQKNCSYWNYHGYSIVCFTVCLKLVEVSIVFVFLRRGPVRARFRVPRRPVPFWNLPTRAFHINFPSDCHFLCFQLSKPIYSLSKLAI